MKNQWLAALLCLVFALVATGCGNPRAGGDTKRRYAPAQTGSNIPRSFGTSSNTRQSRLKKERAAEAKREKRADKKPDAEKPKREKRERRPRATDEEVVTRGGFR